MGQKAIREIRIGRPPAGIREGERVKDYPQISLRVPPEVRLQLAAISQVYGVPQWRVVLDAVDRYVREQSPDVRRTIQQLVNSASRRERDQGRNGTSMATRRA